MRFDWCDKKDVHSKLVKLSLFGRICDGMMYIKRDNKEQNESYIKMCSTYNEVSIRN